MIYLDNAATTFPKPKSVVTAVNNCLKEYSVNTGRSGYVLALKATDAVYNCRVKLAELFGAEAIENVIFTANCTMSINMVLKGLLKPGDHVICSCLEHNAVVRPLNKLKKAGIEYDVARIYPESVESTIKSFEALIKNNTKLIVCTHASNVCGIVMPIKEIGLLANSYGIAFAVDAAQTAGVIEINMKDMYIDFLCIAPHKGLYAPMGTGVLISNKEMHNTIIEGGTGSMSMLPTQPDFIPDKFESGTVNLPGIVGISAGLDFINEIGIDKIYKTEMQKISRCYYGLSQVEGIQLYTKTPTLGGFAPVLSFNLKNISATELGDALAQKGIMVRTGLHCAPMAHQYLNTLEKGTVRICPSVFTKDVDIENLVHNVKILAKT